MKIKKFIGICDVCYCVLTTTVPSHCNVRIIHDEINFQHKLRDDEE